MDKETRAHNRVLAEYQRRMQDILDRYSRDMSRLAGAVQADPDRPFAFSDYPPLKDRHAAMLAEMRSLMVSQVEDAVRQEWGRADRKNDALAVSVIGSEEGAAALGYIRRNTDALEAFMTRKTAGMDLSGRVWDITGQFDTQVQDAIDTALLDGKSADELSREVRNLLHNPDALFRRVRDNRGLLHLSRNAKAYHPGQGVYRSAYMNARRMAATEINMAYRTADHLRVQQMDFVVGIEVHLSGNHNCKGVPPGQFVDICDELHGRYPKDFKFTGWHPFCRCYATSVLKTRQEMKEDAARIRNGEKPSESSINSVDTLPEGFTKWVDRNQQRIATARTLPYFLRDNGQINANGAWEPFNQIAADTKPTLLEIAAKRHAERTESQIISIKLNWALRKDAFDTARSLEQKYGGILDFDKTKYDGFKNYTELKLAAIRYEAELDRIFARFYDIEDPIGWAKKFTLADIEKVQQAVESKIASWQGLPFTKLVNKTEFEIKWVEDNKRYATWEIAQGAYKKYLDKLNRFDKFARTFDDSADALLRPLTEFAWKKMTKNERIAATKYTQTFSYLNEPLRGLKYYGPRTADEYKKDLKALTNALGKTSTTETIVVRRGTDSFPIAELSGKELSDINVGEIFTEKGFLSTATRTDYGFRKDLDLVIIIPKGSNGIYAEPFSHYNDSLEFSWEGAKPKIWNGKSVETFSSEREWIGQRGSKFRVVAKEGNTIYLELIGQLE